MMNINEGEVINFTADRGGRDIPYRVKIIKRAAHGLNKWVVEYKGAPAVLSISADGTVINKMYRNCGAGRVHTICELGSITA